MKIKRENLFYIYIAIMTFIFYIRFFRVESALMNSAIYILMSVGLILFGIYYIFQKDKLRYKILHLAILMFIIFIYFISGKQYEYLIFTVLALLGVRNKSLKKIMKIFFYTYLICMASTFFLCLVGIRPDVMYSKISSGKTIQLHSLGFPTGNNFFAMLFILYVSLIYYKYEKLNYVHLIGMEIIGILFYFIFYARTGIILITILTFGTIISKYVLIKNRGRKLISVLEIISNPAMFIFTYLFSTKFYGSAIQVLTDKMVSDRLEIANIYFEIFPAKLFQTSFHYIGDLPVDNLYAFVICGFGFAFAAVIGFIYVKTMIRLYKRKKYFEMFIVTLFVLYAYSEKFFINAFRNPSMFLLGIGLFKNNNMLEEEKIE